MNTRPLPPHPAPALAPVELAQRLEGILASIAQLVFGRVFFLGDLAARLHNRIGRARQRIATLLALLAAGRLPRQQAPRPGQKGGPPPFKFSLRRGWFIATFGQNAGGLAAQLEHLLNTPEARAALAAAPPTALKSLARTVRPLCRVLGVTLPPILQPAAPPAPRRQQRPQNPKQPRKQAPALAPTDRPLPAYVAAAARAWRRRTG